MPPSDHVLDLFAVPAVVEPLAGGQGRSVRAGDLVLSPDREPQVLAGLNPVLARLAVELDTRPRRDVRVAMPVPARDGEWVVEGWAASRYEPGSRVLNDLALTRAVGALLHAELAVTVTERPAFLDHRADRWSWAELFAFDRCDPGKLSADAEALMGMLLNERDETVDLGVRQLVHGDLAGNILLDGQGTPVVIDFAPYWRPALWAEAVAVLDSVLWWGADPSAMNDWAHGVRRQAMIRAALYRLASDVAPEVDRYRAVLRPVIGPSATRLPTGWVRRTGRSGE